MALTEQLDNIEAIQRYIGEQEPPRTPAAVKVRDQFLGYMSTLGTWDLNFEPSVYDRVRNFKLEYNRANAVTPEEKMWVEEVAKTGLSSEQLRGEADRRTSDGTYIPAEAIKDQLTAPLVKALVIGGVVLAAVLLVRNKL